MMVENLTKLSSHLCAFFFIQMQMYLTGKFIFIYSFFFQIKSQKLI